MAAGLKAFSPEGFGKIEINAPIITIIIIIIIIINNNNNNNNNNNINRRLVAAEYQTELLPVYPSLQLNKQFYVGVLACFCSHSTKQF